MCSILGYFNPKINSLEIAKLNQNLSHRGPDNSTIKKYSFRQKELFLAHNRLSIQDLSDVANQPMENERFVIVFNGEIYNHLELRKKLTFKDFKTHSDTETLLFAFSEFGIKETLNLLNGMFAIALFDKLEQKLYLIRDRVGKKPLYFTFQNGEFAFASELKGMSAHLKTKTNNKALIQFMTLSYIPHDNSYYEDIYKLKPAHFLVFDGVDYKIERYWDLPKEKLNITFDEACEKTEELLKKSIQYRLISDLEVGSFLSGGVDSSLVSYFMQKLSSQKIKTFSIGFEDRAYDESIYAKEVAKFIGSEHYEYHFKANDVLNLIENFDYFYDEPFGDASSLPMMILSKITKEKVTVALSGDGGDELFFGYDRYFFTKNYFEKLNKFPYFIRVILSEIFKSTSHDKLNKISYPIKHLTPQNLYSVVSTSIKPWDLKELFSKEFIYESFKKESLDFFDLQEINLDEKELFELFSMVDFYRYIPDDIAVKVDRASMKYTLEVRNPLLDVNLIEFAYSLPTNIKLQNGAKSILKAILYKHVPKELIDRPKRGFSVPLKEWFRGDLRGILLDKIENLDSKFNKNYLKKLYNAHQNGANYEYVFWNILRLKD
ncbi:MAG: asparagine synthase (glutamine-hydrolyzing) [Campylobacterales bacterium]|nr:asparagine synthase (glutamine-hydrolyzing) [Campylobacterales bacterium]